MTAQDPKDLRVATNPQDALAAALHKALCVQNVPLHGDKVSHGGSAILAALARDGWVLEPKYAARLTVERLAATHINSHPGGYPCIACDAYVTVLAALRGDTDA